MSYDKVFFSSFCPTPKPGWVQSSASCGYMTLLLQRGSFLSTWSISQTGKEGKTMRGKGFQSQGEKKIAVRERNGPLMSITRWLVVATVRDVPAWVYSRREGHSKEKSRWRKKGRKSYRLLQTIATDGRRLSHQKIYYTSKALIFFLISLFVFFFFMGEEALFSYFSLGVDCNSSSGVDDRMGRLHPRHWFIADISLEMRVYIYQSASVWYVCGSRGRRIRKYP